MCGNSHLIVKHKYTTEAAHSNDKALIKELKKRIVRSHKSRGLRKSLYKTDPPCGVTQHPHVRLYACTHLHAKH